MELAKVKKFVYYDARQKVIYTAKDLSTIFEEFEDSRLYAGLYGIIDTEIGEVMFKIDESYFGEPIVMDRVMHWDSFMKFHCMTKFIKL
jgi:hypothetical protein